MKTLMVFIVLNVVNVILQTVKSLVTNKGNKWTAALINAVAYGLYTVVLVYMTCPLSTAAKAVIVGGCNLIGVFVVKHLEEKTAKRRIFKIEFTVDSITRDIMLTAEALEHFNYINVGDMTIFNFYVEKCELKKIKTLVEKYKGKYIITEGKAF